MKNRNALKTLLMVMLMFCTNYIYCQTIPQKVADSFSAKYPQAKVKQWKTEKAVYIVKFTFKNNNRYAYYSLGGNWLKTESKIKWGANLPAPVKQRFKKSPYSSWNIESIKEIETPVRRFYQIYVDNRNIQADAFHNNVFTKDKLLYFTDNGEPEKDLSE
jgi:hypothetical protein